MKVINFKCRAILNGLLLSLLVLNSSLLRADDGKDIKNEIVGYMAARITSIVSIKGVPSIHTRNISYPVLFVDFGSRCEFFLKNARRDITQDSRVVDRVYLKDVTSIKAIKGVSFKSDNYGLNVYVGNRLYIVKKWRGMASLKPSVTSGDCNRISKYDLTYETPTLNFRVATGKNTTKWLEAGFFSITDFETNRGRGLALYNRIQQKSRADIPLFEEEKSFAQLTQEALQNSSRIAAEQEKKKVKSNDNLLEERALAFRAAVSEGDDSHCGLVVEVRDKVVKVQTQMGEHWLKRSQLYPPKTKPCNFLNGVYQTPR